MSARGKVERTGERLLRWRVSYVGYREDEGMGTETLHFTRLGARFSRWLWTRWL